MTRELVVVLDQPHLVERDAHVADLGRRGDAGAGLRAHVVQPAHDARVPGRVHARRVVERGLVRDELRQLCVELADRVRLVEAERFARRLGAVAEAVPQLALRVLLAAEEDRLRRRARDEHQHRLGLGEAGEVIEIAVEAVEVVAVAVAHALGRGRHDREPGADPLEHRGAPGAVGACRSWRIVVARDWRHRPRLADQAGSGTTELRVEAREALGRADVDPAAGVVLAGHAPARRGRAQHRRERARAFPARCRRTAPAGRRRCR